jgi:hypothetical protein
MSGKLLLCVLPMVFCVALVSCQKASRSTEAPPASGSSVASSTPTSAGGADDVAHLCAGRAGCRVRNRRAVPGANQVALVELALSRGPSSAECDGGEYWLVRSSPPSSARRIAQDCNAQTEADGLAHADARIDGGEVVLSYEELQGGDRCAGVDARIHPSPLQIVKEVRWDGTSARHQCRRENEMTTDWDASDHFARWMKAHCNPGPTPSERPKTGAAIPKFALDGSVAPTTVGGCGVLIDATRAGRWMKPGAAASGVRLRTAVVDEKLLIDVEGATAGAISVVVAAAVPGDGDHGGVGCGSDEERRVSVTTLHLEDGRTESKGLQAPFLKVSARNGGTVHLATESIASVGRVALSYEAPNHERLDSALLHGLPAASDLPPLSGPFKASERCRVEEGRLEVRSDNAPGDPALHLR